jgi:hypothetical protein
MAFNRDINSIFDKYVNNILEPLMVERIVSGTPEGDAALANNEKIINKKNKLDKDKRDIVKSQTDISKKNLQGNSPNFNSPATGPLTTTPLPGGQKTIDDGSFWDQMAANAGLGSSASPIPDEDLNKTSTQSSNNSKIDDGSFWDQMAANAGLGSSASPIPDEDLNKTSTQSSNNSKIVIGNPTGAQQSPLPAAQTNRPANSTGVTIGNPTGEPVSNQNNKPITTGNITIGNPTGEQPAATTQPAQPVTSGKAPTSVVDYLKSSGQASDFQSRKKMAETMGIQNYSGTAEQNIQLLKMAQGQGSQPQQAQTAASALPGAGTKPGQIKTPVPSQQQPNLPPGYVERSNSQFKGIPGSISNAIGRAGDTARNIAMGTVGKVNPKPTSQPSQQTSIQPKSTQKRRPTNPKVR